MADDKTIPQLSDHPDLVGTEFYAVRSGTDGGVPIALFDSRFAANATTVSQAEAEAGVSTTVRRWTAQRVSQAITALGGGAVSSIFGRTGAVVAAASDYDADQVDVTPTGNIASTDVQAALAELDTEKSATAHTHAGVYEPVDATILKEADVDDTPVNGVTAAPVSSNWAYDHVNASNPHSITATTVSLNNVANSLQVINAGSVVQISEGVIASRPAAGNVGHYYISTDETPVALYRDSGSLWEAVGGVGLPTTPGAGVIYIDGSGEPAADADFTFDVTNDVVLANLSFGAQVFEPATGNITGTTTTALFATGGKPRSQLNLTMTGNVTAALAVPTGGLEISGSSYRQLFTLTIANDSTPYTFPALATFWTNYTVRGELPRVPGDSETVEYLIIGDWNGTTWAFTLIGDLKITPVGVADATTARTLTIDDTDKVVRFTNAAAKVVTVNDDVFNLDDWTYGRNVGAGDLTFAGSATLNGSGAIETDKSYALHCVDASAGAHVFDVYGL